MTTHPAVSPALVSLGWQTPKSRRGISVVGVLGTVGVLGLLIALLLPAVRSARPAAYRSNCANNLKQIAMSLRSYADANHGLPPYTVDGNGKPLHSWRALILPYLGRNDLYQKIDFSKPWNDPANEEVYKAAMPNVYRCPSANCQPNFTTYLAVATPNGCFRASDPRSLSDITSDHAKTLMLIEVAAEHAVHWMAPTDADEMLVMEFGPNTKLPHTGGTNAAFGDGSVLYLDADMPAAERRALISIPGTKP